MSFNEDLSERYCAPSKVAQYTLFKQPITLTDLATLAGINVSTMHVRLRRGMSPEDAISVPVRRFHEDLSGNVYGRMTVVERGSKTNDNKQKWWCRCACGREDLVEVVGADLKSGQTASCGCRVRETSSARAVKRAENLTGHIFADGNLEVLGVSDNWKIIKRGATSTHRTRLWKCLCRPCGTVFETLASFLRAGQVTSCGCKTIHRARVSASHRANSERFLFRGENVTLLELEARTGIAVPTLRYRIKHAGMSIEEAATLPMQRASSAGKPKLCRWCRKPGHNTAKCPSRLGTGKKVDS